MTEDIATLAGKRPGPGTLYGARVLKARLAALETLARAGQKRLADA